MAKDWPSTADVGSPTPILASLPVTIETVCYETEPTVFCFARSFKKTGIIVIVAALIRMPCPGTPTNKAESLDCLKLAGEV